MKSATDRAHSNLLVPLIACLLLFIGIGRIFSLVMHNPVLGYANNYDMIRLQACHQIWPADDIVNITSGTPAAPLRRYALDKHVDTPCFPSSELLFTGISIELGKLKNLASGEVLISIKTIGLVKATFLAFTAIFASLYFYRRNLYGAMLTNGLVMLLVLSDPGVTLYLNAFYKQFSAIYFLYVALIGVVVFAQSYRPAASWLLLIGLLGLGFSKPQYMPLALTFALLLSAYVIAQKQWKAVPAILLCAALPLMLQASGYFTPRNDSMIRASHVNFVASILAVSNTPDNVLADLGLPKDCQALAGKNGYDPVLQKAHSCPEVDNLSNATAAYTLLSNPRLLIRMATRALEQQQNWLQDSLGQVEGQRNTSASLYQRTLGSWLPALPAGIFNWLPLLTVLLPVLLLIRQSARQNGVLVFILLLGVLQLALVFFALLNDGLVEIGQNLFLLVPLVISEILCVPWLPRLNNANG